MPQAPMGDFLLTHPPMSQFCVNNDSIHTGERGKVDGWRGFRVQDPDQRGEESKNQHLVEKKIKFKQTL